MQEFIGDQRIEPRFPFTAIVGQRAMKRALLLNAINPKIGGVLVRGKKGTAKSTAVRALAALLPEVALVSGCPYLCSPDRRQGLCSFCGEGSAGGQTVSRQTRIIELPVGATEDRLAGSLDVEQAIKTGKQVFEPGLLAAAHRGILYIDEVNLLNDHLVDLLLDAASMGRNYVEREGVSISHASEFILIGTMNPEEGELRPQLLDRFGLAVEADGGLAPQERAEVVRRRIAYEADPYGFVQAWSREEEQERARIRAAQEVMPLVKLSDEMLELITTLCVACQVDGLRADIVMYKTASTIAAYEGRREVIPQDVRQAGELALSHRQRRQPFQRPGLDPSRIDEIVHQQPPGPRDRQTRGRAPGDGAQEGGNADDEGPGDTGDSGDRDERRFEVGAPFPVRPMQLRPQDSLPRAASGRRTATLSSSRTGRYIGVKVPQGQATDLALDATLRAAAPYQQRRSGPDMDGCAFHIERWDIREKVRETTAGALILFVVDASGSMGAQRRMVAVKGAILSLLLDAYQRRDQVGMVSFRGNSAELLLPPTRGVEQAKHYLEELPTGGRTPLSSGLYLALETIEAARSSDRGLSPLLALVSDGRANHAMQESDPLEEAKAAAAVIRQRRLASVVIDTESGFVRTGLARVIAEALGARYLRLEDLSAESLAQAIRVHSRTAIGWTDRSLRE